MQDTDGQDGLPSRPSTVTPALPAPAKAGEPGSIHDSRYRRGRQRVDRTAGACPGPRSGAAARTEAGPRLGGRGDEEEWSGT